MEKTIKKIAQKSICNHLVKLERLFTFMGYIFIAFIVFSSVINIKLFGLSVLLASIDLLGMMIIKLAISKKCKNYSKG